MIDRDDRVFLLRGAILWGLGALLVLSSAAVVGLAVRLFDVLNG